MIAQRSIPSANRLIHTVSHGLKDAHSILDTTHITLFNLKECILQIVTPSFDLSDEGILRRSSKLSRWKQSGKTLFPLRVCQGRQSTPLITRGLPPSSMQSPIVLTHHRPPQ